MTARDSRAFERWLKRQEERSEYGEQLGFFMSLLFYCDPHARCVSITPRA
ncbi:MAG TPA: hypothetical protein VEU74_11955 [Gemmatimonadales bacterium]|nr:hypothetical protein [Gemmatimonadales bacterium]